MPRDVRRHPVSRGAPRSLFAAAVFFVTFGCASGAGAGFLVAKGQGDRAYSSGRYEEAAGAYEEAGRRATRPRDRAEALYLEASAFARARSWQRARAVFGRLIAEIPASERAHRASFDLAELEIDAGNADRGFELLYAAMMKYPNDGLARRALERWLNRLEERNEDVLGWLRTALHRFDTTELDETVRYRLAGRLEASSELREARDAYVACAERHPYPSGGLFDDALWHASLIDEKLGRPEDAVADLRRMLAFREVSTFAGSYERPRFSPAQFRIAVLYRDKLRDHASARREFHQVYASHTTSVLRDDALWEEAKLAHADGDGAAACALVATLARDFHESRYAPCTQALCATVAPSQGACHAYLVGPAANGMTSE
jgi:tetratricopeptide (TPR) repeat protein